MTILDINFNTDAPKIDTEEINWSLATANTHAKLVFDTFIRFIGKNLDKHALLNKAVLGANIAF